MITELRITDLGVIGSAVVEPAAGLTAVTGETGAGKTMIVTGLGLLSGRKGDAGLVRRGAEKARLEGRISDVPPAVAEQVEEAGGVLDGDELIVARQLGRRSRSFLGGAGVPAQTQTEIVEQLITIHGQSGQIRLSEADRQRELLDSHAGAELADVLTRYRRAYAERRAATAELDRLENSARERAREIDLLQFGLAEIEQADPQPNEDAELGAEAQRLQAVDDLRSAAQRALNALAGADDDIDAGSALTAAAIAQKALEGCVDDDANMADLARRAGELSVLANDLSADVASYLSGLEADPGRLERIAGRRAELAGLTRKYGATIDEVLQWAADSAQKLTELSAGDDRTDELRARVVALDAKIDAEGRALTRLRQQASTELAEAVQTELSALAMPHARLGFTLTPLTEPGPHGLERVELLFTANPGSEPRPIGKVASGGELSRVRLGLEVVLASGAPGHTFVFDEVDAGVGGAVAVEIGRRLARLAQHSQVIVVTHLAQVAAFADRHFVVRKQSDGQVTTSGVRLVADDERAAELARMMAGLETTDTALAHARELLSEAGH